MYLRSRLDFLLDAQNSDGGWGYFPGKRSWLEPTVYAMLALDGDGQAQGALQRAWKAVRSWQLPEGAWRGGPQVQEPHWTTALAVTLHVARGQFDQPFRAGVDWLLSKIRVLNNGAICSTSNPAHGRSFVGLATARRESSSDDFRWASSWQCRSTPKLGAYAIS